MTIQITGDAKEIAALVLAIQERRGELLFRHEQGNAYSYGRRDGKTEFCVSTTRRFAAGIGNGIRYSHRGESLAAPLQYFTAWS